MNFGSIRFHPADFRRCRQGARFYVGFLGFSGDWEHRFEPDLPLYMQVSRGECRLHLSGHHGDSACRALRSASLRCDSAFLAELTGKPYGDDGPAFETPPWGGAELTLIDPFSRDRLTFVEGPAVSGLDLRCAFLRQLDIDDGTRGALRARLRPGWAERQQGVDGGGAALQSGGERLDPRFARAKLERLAGRRLTEDGVIIIQADRFRTQDRTARMRASA